MARSSGHLLLTANAELNLANTHQQVREWVLPQLSLQMTAAPANALRGSL